MKKKEQVVSLVGVVALALLLPGLLRLSNNVVRYLVGAEGRLAAITVDTGRPLGMMKQPWGGLAQGGENLSGFLEPNIAAVKKIKPKFIRIDHVYDHFDVVKRNGNRLVFDWQRLDKVVEEIIETGATPFLALSYTPPALTANGEVTDEPTNWDEWATVVQRTVEHYSGEKGIADIYYEVWNEPDLFGKWKIGGRKDYRTLYFYSVKGAMAAKNVKDFKVGGPATTGLYKNWVNDFLKFVLENRLRLDFISWHRYDLNIERYNQDIADINIWLNNHPYFSNVEKIITEMGPDSKPGGENDTLIGGAHLVAVMRELINKLDYGFTFAVDGQWGILGKPRYEALEMLGRLGNQRLSVSGEGSWVRAIAGENNGAYQVLITNYDPREIHNEVVPVTFTNLKETEYTLRITQIGQNTLEQKIATSEAIWQYSLPMTSNEVALLELTPKATASSQFVR